jgi:hypothetical protein
MTTRTTWACIAGCLLPLLYVYVSFIQWLYQNPRFFPANNVEMTILVTQVARTLIILAVPRFRRAGFLAVLDVFTIEILTVPVLVIISLGYGDASLLAVAGQIIWAWPPAFLIAFLPLSMYRLVSKMSQNPSLSLTIPAITGIFVSLAFLASATTSYTSVDGLMGISKLVVAAIFGSIIKASIPYDVTAAGIALYLVLIVYAVSQGNEAPAARGMLLVLAVVGAAAAIGWELAAGSFTGSDLLVFGLPAIVLAGLIWGVTRER